MFRLIPRFFRIPIKGIITMPQTRFFSIEDECDKVMVKNFRSSRHPDVEIYKKQLLFRGSRMGQKELELIVHDYLLENMNKMSYKELVKFEEEILLSDNMILFNHILGVKKIKDLSNESYIYKVNEFAKNRDGKKGFSEY